MLVATGGDPPDDKDLSKLMPASAPVPPPPGTNWAQLGTAIGAIVAVLGGAFTASRSDTANTSAIRAQSAEVITSEMVEQARKRMDLIDAHADENERRIAKLEAWIAVQEAKRAKEK